MIKRNGIWCVGNILDDNIKRINDWPQRETLAFVDKIELSPGGGAVNVALDLARAELDIPLYLGGKIGHDHFGNFLMAYFKNYNIDLRAIEKDKESITAWTDVMTEKNTGKRTFFHHTGAADTYHVEDIKKHISIPSKIFYIAYLSLLKSLDAPDTHYGCKAGALFAHLQAQGFIVAMDCVSAATPSFFQDRIIPALPYVDILILNEYEAQLATAMDIDIHNEDSLSKALKFLNQKGPRTIVIHFPQGAAAYHQDQISFHKSYKIPSQDIKGSVGAGDAFSAGLLYGLHEDWDIHQSIDLACCMARYNLTHLSATEGIKPLKEMRIWQQEAVKYS